MYPISNEGMNKETDTEVYFMTNAFYPLDNFSAHTVELWGIKFPTSEHAFQWKKFSGVRDDIAGRVLASGSPEQALKVATVHKSLRSSTWQEDKVAVMEEILTAKAEQHEDVKEVLQKTGNRTIIENSPVDDFWGIGPNKDGQNMVGKLWMKVRDKLK